MTETVFAYYAVTGSGDSYLGLCRVPQGASQIGVITDAIREHLGDEYPYVDELKIETDVDIEARTLNWLRQEVQASIRNAYELEL